MFTRENLEKHCLDMRQFIDARPATLANGMRIIEVYNSSGLSLTLLPDRGLDIWTTHYKGMPLTWISQGAPHPPDFGSGWLRQFNGGLLVTCGLRHAGHPETDPATDEQRDIHGNFTRLRADDIAITRAWQGEQYHLEISGTLAEARFFGEQLRLRRTYRITLGEPTIHIHDEVSNLSDEPAPLMLLYHINLGYPLLSDGTRLHLPSHKIYPREAVAQSGLATWDQYGAPVAGYPEQVFFHHLKADDEGWTEVALIGDMLGMSVRWDTRQMPYFTQWKNLRQGVYVSGIEPGNCIPEGQNGARESGRLQMLQPHETHTFDVQLAITDESTRPRIEAIGANGHAIPHCHLDDLRTLG